MDAISAMDAFHPIQPWMPCADAALVPLRSFSAKTGFGFIACPELHEVTCVEVARVRKGHVDA